MDPNYSMLSTESRFEKVETVTDMKSSYKKQILIGLMAEGKGGNR